jgi:hypothetical protein
MTDTLMLGVNTAPYSGMYALQGQGCGVAMLADVTSATTWPTQVAFAVAEGLYMIMTDPPGEALSASGITSAVTNKQEAGVDSPWAKLMFGDWVYWQDTANNVLRLVSPQAFVAGRLANLAQQAALCRGGHAEIRHSRHRAAERVCQRRSLSAVPERARRDRQSAAGRRLLGRARRLQHLL